MNENRNLLRLQQII